MKIAVIGSRDFKEEIVMDSKLDGLFDGYDNTLISGGARGPDKYAENYVKNLTNRNEPIIFKAKWDDLSYPDAIIKRRPDGSKYDAKAGIRRNKQIIDASDYVIAFWNGETEKSGTWSSIQMAKRKGIPIDVYIRK